MVSANEIYDDCIKSYDYGGIATAEVIVTPLNDNCQTTCARECNSFSRKTKSPEFELNNDIILECKYKCQTGHYYASYIREEVKDPTDPAGVKTKIVVRNLAKTKVLCAENLNKKGEIFIKNSQFIVNDKDEISVRLIDADKNKIYMCGQRSVQLTPIIRSSDPAVWQNDTALTEYKSQEEHICFNPSFVEVQNNGVTDMVSKDNFIFATATNYKLWMVDAANSYKLTDKCYWNARNPNYTDTNIWVKDGDELTITYRGDFKWLDNGLDYRTRKNLYDITYNPEASNGDKNLALQAWVANSFLNLQAPGSTGLQNYNLNYNLVGEDARVIEGGNNAITQVGRSTDARLNSPDNLPIKATQFGLIGKASDENFKGRIISEGGQCDTQAKQQINPECYKIDDPGTVSYSFSGILKDFSSDPVKLGVRHYNDKTSNYVNNLGGYDLTILWSGCTLKNGQNLQYAILDPTSLEAIPDEEWQDVTPDIIAQEKNITATKAGTLFFRIKPFPAPQGSPEVEELYTEPGNRFGQYNLLLEKIGQSWFDDTNISGPLRETVSLVREILFGKKEVNGTVVKVNAGVLELLYRGVVVDTGFVQIIRTLLVFYITFFGLGFLIGTIQVNKQDLIIRVLKFSIIVAIISPTSWDFFLKYFYGLFIDGGLELISLIVSGGVGNLSGKLNQAILDDPVNVFGIFDLPFKELFSQATWIKIYALMYINIVGVIFVILIIIAVISYVLTIIRATLIFLVSMIIISLLILMGPIFLCFMLFAGTKQFFDSWWKFLLSFSLQPAAVFLSITIMNYLVIIAFKTSLGFTACPFCFLEINFPHTDSSITNGSIISFCLIPGYQPMIYSHFPEDPPSYFMPMRLLTSVVTFLILSLGMYELVNFIATLINIIIVGSPLNATSLAGYGDSVSPSNIMAKGQRGVMILQSGMGMAQSARSKISGRNAKPPPKPPPK